MGKKEEKKHNKIITVIVISALLIDQITKIISYIQGYSSTVNTNAENSGYYIIMSVIIVVLIIRYMSNDNTFIKLDTKVILSLAIAGVIGNLIDRIWYKDVIVFINLINGLKLNFAYIYIIIAWIGMAIILTKNTAKILKDRKKEKVIKDEYEKNKNKGK